MSSERWTVYEEFSVQLLADHTAVAASPQSLIGGENAQLNFKWDTEVGDSMSRYLEVTTNATVRKSRNAM